MEVKGRHFNLIESGARQVKNGVSHKGWGRRQIATGAFIFTGRNSGKRLVGARELYGGGSEREKIKTLFGASAPVEYFRGKVDEILKRKIKTRFNKLLATALDYQFRKSMMKGKKMMK